MLLLSHQADSGSGIFTKQLKLFSEGLGNDPGLSLPLWPPLLKTYLFPESLSWKSGHFEKWGGEGEGQGCRTA